MSSAGLSDNGKQPFNIARSIPIDKEFNNDYIYSLFERIDGKEECYIRTINLPGLGLGQKMGLEHKVLEVYSEKEITFQNKKKT